MKNILKTMLVALISFSFSSVAQSGDLQITGSAKASYAIVSSDGSAAKQEIGKALGVTNEFSLKASGELDNGMTWAYAQDIDGATAQDDAKLTLTTDYGTLGVFISEGGLDADNAASQSVISRPSDTSFGEDMVDSWDLSGTNTIQYHTPADLIPYGGSLKIAFAPANATSAINDYKASGALNNGSFTAATTDATTATPFGQSARMGTHATHIRVDVEPTTGLKVGADYVDFSGIVAATDQKPESGTVYATYTQGIVSVGLSRNYLTTALAMAQTIGEDFLQEIEGTKGSVAVNVNDDLSISYERERSKPSFTNDTTEYSMTSEGIQAAYTMGGMTLAIARNAHDNAQYLENQDVVDTVFSVAMAF
jgi:hypothetical protein